MEVVFLKEYTGAKFYTISPMVWELHHLYKPFKKNLNLHVIAFRKLKLLPGINKCSLYCEKKKVAWTFATLTGNS
jgi:hypothetical protein